MKTFFAVIGAVISTAAFVLIIPFISFWIAYFGGWLCSLVIGDVLANGLNTLFNTTHFTSDIIPLCAATLGWIGGYFKSSKYRISTDD